MIQNLAIELQKQYNQNRVFDKSPILEYEDLFNNKYFTDKLEYLLNEGSYNDKNDTELTLQYKIDLKLLLQKAFFNISFSYQSIKQNELWEYRRAIDKIHTEFESKLNFKYSITNIYYMLLNLFFKSKYNYKYFEPKLSDRNFFLFLKRTDSVIIIIFASIPYFKTINASTKNKRNILEALSKLFGASEASNGRINEAIMRFDNDQQVKQNLIKFVDKVRSINELLVSFTIKNVISNLNEVDEKKLVKNKISQSEKIKDDIIKYSTNYLSHFNGNSTEYSEWGNRILIITVQLLSVLETIKLSNNTEWNISTFKWAYQDWFIKLSEIVNMHELKDDFKKIANLIFEENDEIEWKSSFAYEIENDEHTINKKKSKILLNKIATTIIGMANNNGGKILVGACENPQKISRQDILDECIERKYKNFKMTFFNINYEFSKSNKDIDTTKRQLQDIIKEHTRQYNEVDKLWSVTQFEIICETSYKRVIIYCINIEKSSEPIFCDIKVSNPETTGLTYLKRFNARTEYLDPRIGLKQYNQTNDQN